MVSINHCVNGGRIKELLNLFEKYYFNVSFLIFLNELLITERHAWEYNVRMQI